MKKILVILAALIMTAACAAPPTNQPTPVSTNSPESAAAMMTEADAIAKEKATWATLEKKDYDAFGNMLTTDYIEVGDDGVFDKAGIVAELKDFTVSDPTFSNWKMMPIDKDAVLLMYEVSFKGTFKGQEVPPGPYRASSVWVNREGKWLAAYYQQTLAKASTTPPMPANTPSAKSSASPAAKTPEAVQSDDPVAREKMVWDALKRKDYDTFASFLDEAQIEVEAEGVTDKAGTLKQVRMFDASKSELSDFKNANFDSDASLVTYVVNSPDPKAKHRASTIWVKRGGKWLALFHQGTPEMPASAMTASKASPSPSTSPAAKASPAN